MHDSKTPASKPAPTVRRREFLQGSLAAGLFAGLPKGWTGGSYASDEPEQKEVRIGIVAVQSCASLVIAHEKGFFEKHGLTSTISKEASWAAARDKLVSGENHGTHMKYAQPIGSSIGVLGAQKTAMIAPFTLSRNGSVFMVAKQLEGKLTTDPRTWKTVADEMRAKGEPFTLALPLPFGWHGLMYRHFLANGGVNADKELKVITLPPAQMVQNIRVGTMQACAMVEPWGARGVAEKVTVITMYGHELWVDHPVKTFGVMETFANENPKTVKAMLRALHEAATWCDDFANREELAKLLSTPSYMNAPVPTILEPLLGNFDWGDGRKLTDRTHAIAYNRDNYPQAREIKWIVSQLRRWGMFEGEPNYDEIAKKVARADLYEEAMKELGVTPHPRNDGPIKLWDGTVFEHSKAAEFAKSFPIHNLKG
ncbi:MAG: ABC transporter substrate-binding protein [Planctomycetes bacterium]|nr:ABC transporter substrate-binding protein [Planctomycetota bacterium]